MTSREKLLRKPIYWFDHEQNEIFRQVSAYMEKEGINQTQLAERLNVGKSYVSQIMNGNCNFSLKKWIELCISIGVVPNGYKSLNEVIKDDLNYSSEKKTEIQSKMKVEHYESFSLPSDQDKSYHFAKMQPDAYVSVKNSLKDELAYG